MGLGKWRGSILLAWRGSFAIIAGRHKMKFIAEKIHGGDRDEN